MIDTANMAEQIPEPTTPPRERTFPVIKKIWRPFNAILFLAAFLAPWVRTCSTSSDTTNGFQVTAMVGGFTFEFFNHLTTYIGPDRDYLRDLAIPLIFIGLVCILLYTLVSFLTHKRRHFYLRAVLLFTGMVGMLSAILLASGDLKELLWGYWLTWIGLGSSVILEIKDRFSSESIDTSRSTQ